MQLMKMKPLLLILLILIYRTVLSINDSTTTFFSFAEYMEQVKEHHPVSMQAKLQVLKGEAGLLEARGAFDPKVFTGLSEKSFDEKLYYRQFDGGLQVPTWFGIALQSGYERNQGAFLNPENTTPDAGLWYAGISLPVGQGLFIDERRAALRQARLYLSITESERRLMLNELLYNAGQAYWNWYRAYHVRKVYEEAVKLAEQRYTAINRSAQLGDRPFIDTLESGIQLQDRKLSLQQAELEMANAGALLSVYLWSEGAIPLEITGGTTPVSLENEPLLKPDSSFTARLDTLVDEHPKLEQFQYKLQQLKVDQRWKREQLKPSLDLKFNPIVEAVDNDLWASYASDHYTLGLSFRYPLFLRKERGQLRLAELKIREASLDMDVQRATLIYKTKVAMNQWNTLVRQLELYSKTVRDYEQLLTGERTLFATGESSVFMVNSREIGYFNARLKLIEIMTKLRQADLEFQYSTGRLGSE